jgi:hypothetical protein
MGWGGERGGGERGGGGGRSGAGRGGGGSGAEGGGGSRRGNAPASSDGVRGAIGGNKAGRLGHTTDQHVTGGQRVGKAEHVVQNTPGEQR